MRVATRTPVPMLVLNLLVAAGVWILWWVLWGEEYFSILGDNLPIAFTMVLGSLVGGGSSEGGGAVAFPVMTKVLEFPPEQARVFTFAIQSMGMGAASICILLSRVPVERKVLLYGSVAGMAGVLPGIYLLAPFASPAMVRSLFTMLIVAVAVAMCLQLRRRGYRRNQGVPRWGVRERTTVIVFGFAGGVASSVLGVGVDLVVFMLLVLYFKVCEKVATPTTVVMMSVVSITAFAAHAATTGQFVGPVVDYWITAVPVVVVGAPLGAWICTRLSPLVIRCILLVLITVELVSTIMLVPYTLQVAVVSLAVLVALVVMTLLMTGSDRYSVPAGEARGAGVRVAAPSDRGGD